MPAKCTQRHTENGFSWVLVLGFFQWDFRLWIIIPETLRECFPGSWDLRLLEVPPVNTWSPKVSKTATVLQNIWCHIVWSDVNTPAPSICPLPAFRPAHTCVYVSPSALSEHISSCRYVPSFDSTRYSSPPCLFCLQTCHSFKCFQNQESPVPSYLQKQGEHQPADIK